ncbi:MAG: sigma-70 family RNA polymerase sigma factor [Patulibacter minatonensis]
MLDPAIRPRTALQSSALRLPGHSADTREASAERRFAEQYARHHQVIYRYCRSILRHDQDAQDAMQATMLKALAGMRDGTLTGDLRPWLFRVAHNECISQRRRTTAVTLELAPERGTDDLAQRVEARAALAQLQADLDDLGDRQRTALVLREFSGLGHDEIAAVLETTPGAVKQTIFEARRALLECTEGRAMSCDEIQRTLSDGDGRNLRSRRLRAHVRDCTACTAFLAQMQERPRQLALIAPALPALAGSALLSGLVGSGGHAVGAGAASATTTAALPTIAGTAAAPTVVAAAATTSAGVGAKVAAVLAAAAVVGGGGAAVVHSYGPHAPSSPAQRHSAPTAGSAAAAGSGAGAPLGDPGATTGNAAAGTSPTTPAGAQPTTPNTSSSKAASGRGNAAADKAATGPNGHGKATSAAAKAKAKTRGNASLAPGRSKGNGKAKGHAGQAPGGTSAAARGRGSSSADQGTTKGKSTGSQSGAPSSGASNSRSGAAGQASGQSATPGSGAASGAVDQARTSGAGGARGHDRKSADAPAAE